MRDPNNPLAKLIRDRLDELGMTKTDLVNALELAGESLTLSAVSHGCGGAGVAEHRRPALAAALQVPLAELSAAAMRRARSRAAS